MDTSVPDALRRVASLLDGLRGLPEHLVTVYSHVPEIDILFGAGPGEKERRVAVYRLLDALEADPPTQVEREFCGTARLGPYTVRISTGFD